MRGKKICAKGTAVVVLATVCFYVLLSFLGAVLCFVEAIGRGEMAALYFAIGLLGAFISALVMRRVLPVKKIWAALTALVVYALWVLLLRGGVSGAAEAWSYPGCGVGALAALFWEMETKGEGRGRGKKRRKKRSG